MCSVSESSALLDELKVPPIEDALSDPLLVREGESLWNLAIRLYGNPRQFRSLHRLLRPMSESPDLIFPFSKIKRPVSGQAALKRNH